MRRGSLWFVVAGLIAGMSMLTSAAVAADSSATRAKAPVGGTVVFGSDQEPKILNGYVSEGNLVATSEVVASLLDGGMEYNHRAQLVPVLFAGQPKVLKNRPLTIRFSYKKAAKWSDGRPITGADFAFTRTTIMNKNFDITSRTGWEDISRVVARGKTVTVTFKRPYAGWKPLVAASPLPAHALRGEDFDKVWRNDFNNPKTNRPIASGPFIFSRWDKGNQLVVVRNPNYWGKKASIARIVYRFLPDTNTQFQALRGGELNMLRPQPQLQIADIRNNARLRTQFGPEYGWEHLDIQQGPKGHPALRKKFVRQALISGINRPQIANALYRTIAPNLPVLNNTIFKPFEPEYAPNWRKWSFSQTRAIRLLRSNGCTGGPSRPGAGGIYSCPGVGRLEFGFVSTAGNQLRELAFTIMQQQLKSIGIQINSRFGPARTVFGTVLSSGNWDLFLFTWLGSPTSPISDEDIHGCKGEQNYMNYCNATVTRLVKQAKFTPNEAARAKLLNRADAIMSNDVPQIPLFARPGFLIHSRSIRGVARNPTTETVFWNANQWTFGAR